MTLEPWQWVLAFAGALLVGVSKTGIAGLGMLFVLVFAHILPSTKQSTGVVLPLLIFGDLVAVLAYRRHMIWSHVLRLFPWTALGVLVGWLTLDRINDRQARVLIGVIVLAMVVLHVFRRRRLVKVAEAGQTHGAEPARSVSALNPPQQGPVAGSLSPQEPAGPRSPELGEHGLWFAVTVGVLAGFTTMVANAAGPLMAIYLLAMRLPKMEYVGTGAVFFMLLNWFKVPFMVGLDLITWETLRFNGLLAPAVLAGALFGRWLLARIDQAAFETLALALSAAAGVKLLF